MTIEEIKALSEVKGQIQTDFDALASQVEALIASGDKLGAAKLSPKLEEYQQLAIDTDREIANQRLKLSSQISDGGILRQLRPMETPATTPEAINAKTSEALSVLLGQPVNMDKEAGWKIRRNISFLTDENANTYLTETFGPENVKNINVFGSNVRLVNTGDGFFPVDKFDLTGKDFMDALGEVAPTAAQMLGYAGGAALTKSVTGAAAGGAAAYTAAGTFQDQLAHAVLGLEKNLGESLARRGTEAAVGMGIDVVGGKVVAPVFRKAIESKIGVVPSRVREISEAAERVTQMTGKPTPVSFIKGSAEKQEKLIRAAQRLPYSKLGRDVRSVVSRLEQVKSDFTPISKLPDAMYDDALKLLKADQDAFHGIVGLYDAEVAGVLRRGARDDLQKRMSRPAIDEEASVKYIRSVLGQAKTTAENAKNQIYGPFYAKANNVISVDPVDFAKHLEGTYYGGASRPAEIQKIIDNLRARPENAKNLLMLQQQVSAGNVSPAVKESMEREIARLKEISGPLNATQLDEQFRIIRDAAPSGPIAGSGVGELKKVTANVSGAAKNYRDDVYRKAGLYDEWQKATDAYSAFREYTGSEVGKATTIAQILDERTGGKMTAKGVLDSFFKSPEDAREILTAVKRDDPANYGSFLTSMQESYLNRIGLNGKRIGSGDSFTFDDRTVMELFGQENQVRGARMVEKLHLLQDHFKKGKIDPSRITLSDVKQLEGVLSKNAVTDLIDTIGKREVARQKAEEYGRNVLIKAAMDGHVEAITRGEFPRALFEAHPEQVRKVFAKFNSTEQKQMRQDFAEYVFSNYPGDPDSTIMRRKLFDGQRLLRDVEANPKLRQNMEIALGEDFTKDLLAAARLTEATKTVPNGGGMRITGVVSPDETGKEVIKARAFAPVQAIMSALGDRYTAMMYRAGQMSPSFMRRLGQREFTEDQIGKAMTTAITASMLTSNGLQAAFETGRYNPEYSYRLGQTLGLSAKKAIDYQKEFGYGTKDTR